MPTGKNTDTLVYSFFIHMLGKEYKYCFHKFSFTSILFHSNLLPSNHEICEELTGTFKKNVLSV